MSKKCCAYHYYNIWHTKIRIMKTLMTIKCKSCHRLLNDEYSNT